MADQVTAKDIEAALADLDFPADKQTVSEHADGRASEAVARTLRSLPLATYENVAEVVRSVDTVEATGQSKGQAAAAPRVHDHPGLAEHMRETRR